MKFRINNTKGGMVGVGGVCLIYKKNGLKEKLFEP
jgi:hypothetical protein